MNVIVFLALAALMCATASSSRSPATPQWHELTPSYSFDEYVRHFNKPYKHASDEYARRAKIFERNLAEILSHNSRPDASWKAGLSQFTDMTKEEVRVRHGYRKDLAQHYRANPSRFESTLAADSRLHAFTSGVVSEEQLLASLPTHVDWREKGAVTAVKDQGHCGSCYSFATAETVESHYFLKTGELAVLAPLQAASCTDNPEHCGGSGGCQGGIPEKCFESIMNKGGLSSEWTYPYTSYFGDNFACNDSRIVPVAKLSSFTKLPNNSYTALMTAVATVGPVAISVDANGWHNYESGVFDSCNMESPLIDHNVQLVGYGVDEQSGTPYWLVRNSWAPHWGENGYIRIRRYPDDASRPCGIDTDPGSGSGCDNGPSTQRVCGMCGILSDSSYPIISN